MPSSIQEHEEVQYTYNKRMLLEIMIRNTS